jgi:hypothetical protein
MAGSPNVLEARVRRTPRTGLRFNALELTGHYAAAGNMSYYPPGGHVPARPGLRGLRTAGRPPASLPASPVVASLRLPGSPGLRYPNP